MDIINFLGIGVALVLAVTLHEAGHGLMAYILGDKTASQQGRMTLNPIAHIDPVGTILLPGSLLIAGVPFLFGYAKPVPVNFSNLKFKGGGVALVAFAGPFVNLSLALVSAVLLHINGHAATPGNDILVHSVSINIMLAVFNLLPILPLDGGRIIHAAMPRPLKDIMERMEKYTFFILILLILTPLITGRLFGHPIEILREILMPPYHFFYEIIVRLSGHA